MTSLADVVWAVDRQSCASPIIYATRHAQVHEKTPDLKAISTRKSVALPVPPVAAPAAAPSPAPQQAEYTGLLSALRCSPKQLPCSFLYDARGSELYEQITQLEEYYPFRTEAAMLRQHAADIIAHIPPGTFPMLLPMLLCAEVEQRMPFWSHLEAVADLLLCFGLSL